MIKRKNFEILKSDPILSEQSDEARLKPLQQSSSRFRIPAATVVSPDRLALSLRF